jgi:hypothetical protein
MTTMQRQLCNHDWEIWQKLATFWRGIFLKIKSWRQFATFWRKILLKIKSFGIGAYFGKKKLISYIGA